MTSSRAATLTLHPRSSMTSSERRCGRSRGTPPWASLVCCKEVRLHGGLPPPSSSHASPTCCCLYMHASHSAHTIVTGAMPQMRLATFSVGLAGHAISPANAHHSGAARWLRPPCEHASITQRLVLRHAGWPEPSYICPANGERVLGYVRLL